MHLDMDTGQRQNKNINRWDRIGEKMSIFVGHIAGNGKGLSVGQINLSLSLSPVLSKYVPDCTGPRGHDYMRDSVMK